MHTSSVAAQAANEVHNVEVFPRENAKAHRTSSYESVENKANPACVIRRGDPFYLAIQLKKPYDAHRDKIRLEFMYGKFNIVIIMVEAVRTSGRWRCGFSKVRK